MDFDDHIASICVQWFSTGGSFAPQRTSGKSGDMFGCHNRYCREGAAGIYWVEAKDAADCPTAHRTAL